MLRREAVEGRFFFPAFFFVHSGVPQTQKLRSDFAENQSYQTLHGVGQNTPLHAAPTATNSTWFLLARLFHATYLFSAKSSLSRKWRVSKQWIRLLFAIWCILKVLRVFSCDSDLCSWLDGSCVSSWYNRHGWHGGKYTYLLTSSSSPSDHSRYYY